MKVVSWKRLLFPWTAAILLALANGCANTAPDGTTIDISASSSSIDATLCTANLGSMLVRYTVTVRDADGNPMNDIDLEITGSFTLSNFSGAVIMAFLDPKTDTNTIIPVAGPDCATMDDLSDAVAHPLPQVAMTYLNTPYTAKTDAHGVLKLVVQYAFGLPYNAVVTVRSGDVLENIDFASTTS